MKSEPLIAGRYRLEGTIGAGGMGTVYKGVDSGTGQVVAVKALRPEITRDEPELVERFEREGEALRRLNHPNIVKVLATDQDEDTHYIVMEYVSGGSLLDRMRKQSLSIPEILNISLDLTDALIRAHRLDIIHRDLKPANVLINEEGVPLLTDFGVARIGGTTTEITETGTVMGTLAYLPPEALSGERIDTRADIWAFGVILYELVAGERPFQGDNTAAILRGILYEPVQDVLRYREPGEIPYALAGLIYWMLEKERDNRPASIRMVGAMLENILTGKELPLNWFGDGSDHYELADPPPTPTPEQAARVVRDYTVSSMRLDDLRAELESTENDLQSRVVDGTVIVTDEDAAEADSWQADPSISRSDWSVSRKRELDRPPRIVISYRPEDSSAIAGRIYDRLVLAFGEENVFKDVDSIPLGSDFKRVLEARIAACDVALVVIGSRWLNAADEQGRLLEQEEDFVRIEVSAALQRDELLVIPVLVDNAPMPEQRLLPAGMQRLTYRNTAPVRNDPDFNRDVEWLINQIHNAFIIKSSRRRLSPLGMLLTAVLFALLLLIGLGVFNLVAAPGSSQPAVAEGAAPEATPDIEIAPIPEGRYRVLVAQPRPIDVTEAQTQQVQDSIVSDLELNFRDVQFGLIAARAYPAVIHNEAEARRVAEEYDAAVIIWGTYNGDFAQLEVQFGDVEVFPDLVYERDDLTILTNARYRLSDPQSETLSYAVISVINMAVTYANDALEVSTNLLTSTFVTGRPANVVGNTPAASYHRLVASYLEDPAASVEEVTRAISLQPTNPGLYAARALAYLRLNDIPAMEADVRSAKQYGAEDWITTDVLLINVAIFLREDFESGLEILDGMLAVKPEDWFLRTFRGSLYYLLGDYQAAQPDIDIALINDPQANFTYAPAIGLALREADFVEAQRLWTEVTTRFPDPRFMERILVSTLNEDASETVLVPFFSAFTNMTRGLWNDARDDAQEVQQFDSLAISDMHFIEGLAQCNLADYAEAEAAYSRAIEIEPDFTLLYLLRAEVRGYQGNVLGAAEDFNAVRTSEQATAYEPLIDAIADGGFSCQTFLETDFNQLRPIETEESS